jgi:hypothetical protein
MLVAVAQIDWLLAYAANANDNNNNPMFNTALFMFFFF